MKEMDPERLRATITAARRGDPEAFQALLEAYGQRLYGYFFRATGREHDAEDLLSEVMLRLVRTLKTYDDRGKFEPWLFRIAANLVRDRLRRGKTNPQALSLSTEDDYGGALADRLSGHLPSAYEELAASESNVELHEALERLDERTRHMVVLRHFAGMGFREIADVFECPVGTVLARVHRGLKALRRLMGAP
jgi:RNA polymerase sigma-70 factor (ECF subfamily)